jgi:hypothetical protein
MQVMQLLIIASLFMFLLRGQVGLGVLAKGLSWRKPFSCFPTSTCRVTFMSSPRGGSDPNKGNHDDIILPKREYGYRLEPFTWDELVKIIDEEKNLAKLSRSEEQERDYQIRMREMKTKWKSPYDHILCSKFGFEKRQFTNETHTVWEAYPKLSEVKEPRKALVKNDFPYNYRAGIEHYVLWKICEDVTDEDIEAAKEELKRTTDYIGKPTFLSFQALLSLVHCRSFFNVFPCIPDLLWWTNPPNLKSLPDLDHIHIIIRRET